MGTSTSNSLLYWMQTFQKLCRQHLRYEAGRSQAAGKPSLPELNSTFQLVRWPPVDLLIESLKTVFLFFLGKIVGRVSILWQRSRQPGLKSGCALVPKEHYAFGLVADNPVIIHRPDNPPMLWVPSEYIVPLSWAKITGFSNSLLILTAFSCLLFFP
jgi:hypothetical protein